MVKFSFKIYNHLSSRRFRRLSLTGGPESSVNFAGETRMRERILAKLADFIYARHKLIVAAGLVVTVFMAICVANLELRLSFIELLDPESPEVKRINYANKNFGGLALLFVIVEAKKPEKARAFADEFADRLMEHPEWVKRVLYKIDPEVFLDHALLFLKPAELENLADRLEKNKEELSSTLGDMRMVSLIDRLNREVEEQLSKGTFSEEDTESIKRFTGPVKSVIELAQTVIEQGPETAGNNPGEIEELKSRLAKRLVPDKFRGEIDLSNPYYTDPTGKHLLMLVRASKPTDDFEWNTNFMEVVEGVRDNVLENYPEVNVRMTGNMAVMRDENRVVRRDMKVVTAVTFIGVLLVFAIGFRGLSPLGMVALSLGMGITWCFGLTYLVIGYLNVITSVFGSIILGMGVDYAILLLTRYTEERAAGHESPEALRITMTQTGKGILTGAVATAGAFYSIGVGNFRAADQMGLIAGNGIFTYCAVMMLVLPSLMVWRDVRAGSSRKERRPPVLMPWLSRTVRRGWALILVAGIIMFSILSWKATGMQLEYDYTKIEAEGLKSMELLKEMPDLFGWGINYGMVFTHSLEQDRKYAQRLRLLTTINRVQALSDFIPPDQERKLDIIRRIAEVKDAIKPPQPPPEGPVSSKDKKALTKKLEHLRAMLYDMETLTSLGGQQKAEEAISGLGAKLEELISAIEKPGREKVCERLGYLQHRLGEEAAGLWRQFGEMTRSGELTVEELPSYLKGHFIGADGAYCIYAFPSGIIWNEFFMERNVYELKSVSPEAGGISVIFQSILTQVKHDFLLIGAAAFLAVFIVLLLDYRNVYLAILTMAPLVAGSVMMVGMMTVLGIKLNFVNMSIVPLIMGIGIDYGVYMAHRWVFEGRKRERIDIVIRSTGRGVMFSALTTIVGFGSLSLASYQGLQSLGQMLVIGIAFCLLTAVVGLPALYHLIGKMEEKGKES